MSVLQSFTRALFMCVLRREIFPVPVLIIVNMCHFCSSSLPEFSFFDPSEPQCREVLLDPSTTIPELFAVLRQWVPQVQKNIDLIGNEVT